MAVKASRYLTHIRRLKEPAEPVSRLLGAAAGLGTKLGPVLLQLPPTWKGDPGLLDETLAEFRRTGPSRLRIAVEMRHESCWTDEMRKVLTEREAALVWAAPRTGGTCGCTRAQQTRGPGTAAPACGNGQNGWPPSGPARTTCTCTSTTILAARRSTMP
jgi:uncharacterized protein YecE (DUF72 family)